jgi:hypothetical protein
MRGISMLNLGAGSKSPKINRLRSKALTNPNRHKGDCRRHVGGVSFEKDLFGLKIINARNIRFRQLFHYIQARGITCALHVASDHLKARATLVTLNGRGISCTFRRRGHEQSTLGEGAFAELLMVLKEIDCTFNLSLLNNATAYGMAATQYGQSTIKPMRAPRRTFLLAVDDLKNSGGSGCVQIVNDQSEVIVTAYVYKGEARTFISGKQGVLESSSSAGRLLSEKEHSDTRCITWKLKEVDLLDERAFQLTNLSIVDFEPFNDGVVFESTEQFLTPFFKKPNLMDTMLFDNIGPKETHLNDIANYHANITKIATDNFSHKINPFWGRM